MPELDPTPELLEQENWAPLTNWVWRRAALDDARRSLVHAGKPFIYQEQLYGRRVRWRIWSLTPKPEALDHRERTVWREILLLSESEDLTR